MEVNNVLMIPVLVYIKMFKDESLDSVTIVSDLKEEKYVRDQLCQTKPIKQKDLSCQVINRLDAETQTEFEQTLTHKTRLKIDVSKELSNFLLTVYPVVSEQLVANIRSHAFDGYEVDWEEVNENEETTCLYTLASEQSQQLKVTSVTWNSTGSVIAAALGCYEHETWCIHQSYVSLWNIDRPNVNVQKPDKIIDSDTCLMSISFNSKHPALLAGGDFSGKVYIWDMSNEDNPLVSFSGKEMVSHQEPVSSIKWIESPSTRTHELLSVGCDGRVLYWEFNQLRKELKILKKFLLFSENIPRRFRRGITRNDVKIGITCLTKSPFSKTDFFIGTENGAVLKCATSDGLPSSDPEFMALSVQAFEGHTGTVTGIDASPHIKELFLSCGSDMTVHIYDTCRDKPIMVLEPSSDYLYSAKWSHSRPTVFFVAARNILVFDLLANSISPLSQIDCGSKQDLSIHTLSCNLQQTAIVATGDSDGCIKVWKLPSQCTSEKHGEANFFLAYKSIE